MTEWKIFRCFAYKHKSGVFVAECIDLNLIATGKTIKKAASNLRNAISGYLDVVADGDTKGLIPRYSPLSHRLHYHAVGLPLFFNQRMYLKFCLCESEIYEESDLFINFTAC